MRLYLVTPVGRNLHCLKVSGKSTHMTVFSIACPLGEASIATVFITTRQSVCNNSNMRRQANYSQNFIRSPKLVEQLLAKSNIKATDTVYDLGAGSGVISSVLAGKAKEVIAVEYEPKTAEILKRNMKDHANVKVITGDVMQLPLPKTPYKVFANIPFHLSSPIVQRFLDTPVEPEAAYLVVQKQFGKKLVATDTTHFTSQLGMLVGAKFKVKVIKNLRRTDFWPHPAVDTVCIEMIKRKNPLVPKERLAAYEKFTTECFSDPKKLAKLPINVIGQTPGFSPSRVSLDQWVILFNAQKRY